MVTSFSCAKPYWPNAACATRQSICCIETCAAANDNVPRKKNNPESGVCAPFPIYACSVRLHSVQTAIIAQSVDDHIRTTPSVIWEVTLQPSSDYSSNSVVCRLYDEDVKTSSRAFEVTKHGLIVMLLDVRSEPTIA
jgi:hypothetical protein